MKPKLLIPILLLSCISCSAQLSLNIKAGSSISFFRNYNNTYSNSFFSQVKEKSKTGFLVGLNSDFKIGNNLWVQPELAYCQKGFVVEDSYTPVTANAGSNQSFKIDWHFVDFPLLLKAQTSKNIFIEFGPSVSFLLKAHFQKESTEYLLVPYPSNVTKYYSRIDAGVNGGLTYGYKKFEIGTRYYIGLVQSKVKTPNSSDAEIIYKDFLPYGKHRVAQFFLVYKLR